MTLNKFCFLLFYEFSENNFIVYTFLYICTSIQNNLEVQSCTCTKQNLEDSLEISLKKILHSAVRLPEVLHANRLYIFFKQSSLMQIITKMSNILTRQKVAFFCYCYNEHTDYLGILQPHLKPKGNRQSDLTVTTSDCQQFQQVACDAVQWLTSC